MSGETRIHDYRKRYWGHDFAIKPHADPVTASVTGWGAGVRAGDLLVLPDRDGACFYVVDSLRRPGDPGDMWFAECRFVPGSSEVGRRAAASMGDRPVMSPVSLTSWQVLREPT